MGAIPSKHSTVPSKTQVHSKNVTAFVSKLHRVMKDPVYSEGVTVDSILEMVDDLAKVYAGRTKYIKAPRPVNGIAPVDTILFMPVPLNPTSKTKPSKPKIPPTSRRALSRNISVAGTSDSKSPCIRRQSHPIVDELSDMIAELVSIDGDNKVDDDDTEYNIGDVHTIHEDECD